MLLLRGENIHINENEVVGVTDATSEIVLEI